MILHTQNLKYSIKFNKFSKVAGYKFSIW
jgi:hypothetical protein